MFIVKNASQHQQPAENCANLFLHLFSCLFLCVFIFFMSRPVGPNKKQWENEPSSSRQTACQSSPRFGWKKKPPKRRKRTGPQRKLQQCHKVSSFGNQNEGGKGLRTMAQTNRPLDVTAAPSYENKINVSQCGSRGVTLSAPPGALLWSKGCTEKYSYKRINRAQKIFKIIIDFSLLLKVRNIYVSIFFSADPSFAASMWA